MGFGIATLSLDNGARLGFCPLPGRWGAASEDLATIRAWRPAIVLSLTEPAELARHGMDDLAVFLARDGIAHAAFPIRDFGTPGRTDAWPGLAARLHATLDSGGAVLCHCYGGLGRSGMVVMRLLVDRGQHPARALAALRALRPQAVETAAQEAWASGEG